MLYRYSSDNPESNDLLRILPGSAHRLMTDREMSDLFVRSDNRYTPLEAVSSILLL